MNVTQPNGSTTNTNDDRQSNREVSERIRRARGTERAPRGEQAPSPEKVQDTPEVTKGTAPKPSAQLTTPTPNAPNAPIESLEQSKVQDQPIAEPNITEPSPDIDFTPVSQNPKAPPLAPIPGDLLYRTNYSSLPDGTPSIDQAKEFKNAVGQNVLYVKGFGALSQENDTQAQRGRELAGQINTSNDIVRVGVNDGTLDVLYPEGGNTSSHSGLQYLDQIPGTVSKDGSGQALDEVYMNYQVKFEKDFPWQGGGKLPGVIASDAFGGKEDLSSLRLMWREEGKLEFYIHTPEEDRTRLPWNNGDSNQHASARAGEWADIQLRVKLNSIENGVPQADGELEGWLNGERVASYNDVKIRANEDTNINSLFFSTFYGGSSGSGDPQWWPLSDSRAQFSDVQISKP